ncbi:integrase, partial [Enterovibrio nigricans]
MDALAYENKMALQRKIKASFDNRRLSELIDLWHKLHGKALKDGLRRYKLLFRMAERVNNPIATQFTSEVFAHYRQERANEVSVGTLNREHAYMRAVFNELRRLGSINYENPLTHIRQFKEKEHDLRFLSGSEIQQLLANSK